MPSKTTKTPRKNSKSADRRKSPRNVKKPKVAAPTEARSVSVACRAFEIWLDEGKPLGREMDNWLQAERELGKHS